MAHKCPIPTPDFLTSPGCVIKEFVQAPLQSVTNEAVAPFLAFTLVVFAVGLILFYLFVIYLPIKNNLRKANGVLDRVVSRNPSATEDERRGAFAAGFVDMDSALRNNAAVKHGWQEFRETLIVPEDLRADVVRNMVRPQTYINIRELFGRRLSPKFLAIFPNLFVGIGLLLTFVGLVAALMVTTKAMGGGDMKAMQGALKDLLSAASLKFWTSVAGLGCSILLTIFHRFFMASLERSYSRICKKLEEGLLFVSEEDLVQQQLVELKDQSAQLKQFNTEIGVTLGNSLKDTMPGVMTSALEPLLQSFDELKKELQDSGQKTVEAVHSGLGDVVQGAAGSEMKELAVTLQGLGATLNETKEAIGAMKDGASDQMSASSKAMELATQGLHRSMGEMTANMSRMMDEMASQSKASIDGFAKDVAVVTRDMTKGVMSVVDRMQDTLQTASGQSAQMGQAFDSQMSGAMAGMTALLERVGQQNEEMTSLLQRQSEAATRNFVEEVARSLQAMQEKVQESLHQTSGQSDQMGQAFQEQMSGAISGMTALLERVGQQNEDMTALLQRQSDEAVKRFSEETARATHAMHEKVQESVRLAAGQSDQMGEKFEAQMSGAIEGMTLVLERLGRQSEEMTQLLQSQSDESIKRFAQEMERTSAAMAREIASVMSKTEAAASQMELAGNGVAKAATPLSSLGTSLLQATKSMEQSQKDTLESLRAIQGSMQGSAQELIKGMQTTAGAATNAWESYKNRFEQVDGDLEKILRDMVDQISANQGQMLGYVKDVDKQLGNAVKTLGGGIENLSDVVEEVHEISKALSRSGSRQKQAEWIG